ncbi:hypothetical protein [Bacteroidetes bacterium endosymbiont of Geopemphigus sp.]|uniref:hypothetical protein n=1 Tax=Bacteroidetes bacterium endosymbiont of Geopemphigus sp. TaxID=2047937 RepID=UPI000CD2FAA4|nr:hypothetical protein [Bacteroidetes bacterium endosymbiont of Geopemphigus sp.]
MNLYDSDLRFGVDLIMTAESYDISENIIKVADVFLKFRCRGGIDSLNVRNATAIILLKLYDKN